MDVIKILLKYFATQHGITEEAAAELLLKKSEDGKQIATELSDEAVKILAEKDKERVEKLKGNVDKTKIFNEAYNKAKKEEVGKVEKTLAERFNLDNSLKLDELITAIAESKAPKGGELTDESVKKHPLYVSLERAKTTELKELTDSHKAELEKVQKTQQKASVVSSVTKSAMGYFDSFNPVLSEDKVRATNQRNEFAKKFADYDYEPISGSNDYVILDKDGKRLEDGHGNALTLEAFTRQLAEPVFDFAVQNPKGNSGNEGKAGGAVKAPNNEDEYNTAIFNASSPEERAEITAAWEASNSGS